MDPSAFLLPSSTLIHPELGKVTIGVPTATAATYGTCPLALLSYWILAYHVISSPHGKVYPAIPHSNVTEIFKLCHQVYSCHLWPLKCDSMSDTEGSSCSVRGREKARGGRKCVKEGEDRE